MRTLTKSVVPLVPDFYTCGKFLQPEEGVSCGCAISLKTIFNELTKCPQGKW